MVTSTPSSCKVRSYHETAKHSPYTLLVHGQSYSLLIISLLISHDLTPKVISIDDLEKLLLSQTIGSTLQNIGTEYSTGVLLLLDSIGAILIS